MAEALRLDATVIDRFSKPLGELRTKMLSVSRTGAAGTKATSIEFARFRDNVERVTKSLRAGLEPSLAAVGLQGLGAGLALGGVAGAIAGVVASIRKFASSSIEMKNLSRETGIAISTIQQLQSASEQFGAKSENIAAGLAKFRANIFDARKGQGIIGELGIRKGGEELINAMQEASPEAALNKALDFLAQQKDPERQKRLSNLIFGTDDFQKLVQEGTPALRKAMADAGKRLPFISDEDLKKSREYTENIAKLTDQTAALAHKIGEITIPWVSDLVTGLDKAIERGKKFAEEIGPKLSEAYKSLESGMALESAKENAKTIYEKRGIKGVLQELFGFGPAEGEEAKLGQGRPDSPDALRGAGLIRFRDEIREGTKSGVIEGLRQWFMQRAALAGAGIGGSTGRGFGFGVPGGGTGPGAGAAIGALRDKFRTPGGGPGGTSPVTPGGGASPAIKELQDRFAGISGGGSKLSGSLGERTDIAMRAAESQLLKEGVSREHVHAAAAALIGNALGESPLNPSEIHDHGHGYGIYGAGNVRKWRMLAWLKANGYAHDSLEGQAKYMAHEAMTDPRYASTRRALENATRENLPFTTSVGETNFERPGLRTTGMRIQHAIAAYNRATEARLPPNVPRPGTGFRAIPGYENFGVDGTEHRPGAALRAQAAASPFGLSGPVSGARTGKATLEVSLKGFPAANTKADGGSLFDKIEVRRARGMQEAR